MFCARQVLFTSNWREVMGLLIEGEVSGLPYWNIELTALCSYCSYYSWCFGLFRSVRGHTAYLRNNCAFCTLFPLLLQIPMCQSPVMFTSRLLFTFCPRMYERVSYNSHYKCWISSYTAFTGWGSGIAQAVSLCILTEKVPVRYHGTPILNLVEKITPAQEFLLEL